MLARSSLNAKTKNIMDLMIQKKLLNLLDDFDSIALFASFNSEINLWPVIEKLCWTKKVCLPRVEGNDMNFYYIQSQDDLEQSKFGILEPKVECEKACKSSIDIIIVPMLAFDLNLFRIGYGGGYYDRYLQDYDGYALGLAYSFQCVDTIPIEDHDVKCDAIMTEKEKL